MGEVHEPDAERCGVMPHDNSQASAGAFRRPRSTPPSFTCKARRRLVSGVVFGACEGRRFGLTYNQMVVDLMTEDEVDRLFQALADSTRRDILTRSIEREQSVSSLARHYDMSFAAVQKHVAVLERAALVTKERRGREQIVRGHEPTLKRASSLLERYEELWIQRANQMADVLAGTKGDKQ